ncbi:hypothetical protein L4D00_11790 [Photobacterium swingsii]|uniref:hypothetical protein n=1 Tax=Photobacterium swingsii TaxID=680026 RepID=UPI003D138A12
MYFRIIRPTAADFDANLKFLKAAFVGSDDPKGEFEETRDKLLNQGASFYLLSGKGVKLWFAGKAMSDGGYHIIALAGRGYVMEGALYIIERVAACGYPFVTCHTYRKGMRRIFNRLGATEEQVRELTNTSETKHRLNLMDETGGLNG